MNMCEIIIAGDIVPTPVNYDLIEKGTLKQILGEKLSKEWMSVDYRVANLEAPIIDGGKPIIKSGPNLSIPKRCGKGFQTLGISLFGLSNNHIKDYGENGIISTLSELENLNILNIGVGKNRKDAEKGHIADINGKKIGFFACSEHEFSAAGINTYGANAISINSCLSIKKIKDNCEYLIVLFHGGKEHYAYPTPEQQDRCRSFIDAGADLVICQHSHCVGCREIYANGLIIYGQGNFIFNYKNDECWKTGLLVKVKIDEKNKPDIVYIPIMTNSATVELAQGAEAEGIIHGFYNRSEEIKDIDSLYENVVLKDGPSVLRNIAGWNRCTRGIDRFILKNRLIKAYYKKRAKGLMGSVLCESNWEMAEEFLRKLV